MPSSDVIVLFIGIVITAVVNWWKANHDKQDVKHDIQVANEDVKQGIETVQDQNVEQLRLLRENDQLRQRLEAVRIERDMFRDMVGFVSKDPAGAQLVKTFQDRRRVVYVERPPVEPDT